MVIILNNKAGTIFFLVAKGLLIAGTVRTAFAQKSHDLIWAIMCKSTLPIIGLNHRNATVMLL
jgi:hypothetical protein